MNKLGILYDGFDDFTKKGDPKSNKRREYDLADLIEQLEDGIENGESNPDRNQEHYLLETCSETIEEIESSISDSTYISDDDIFDETCDQLQKSVNEENIDPEGCSVIVLSDSEEHVRKRTRLEGNPQENAKQFQISEVISAEDTQDYIKKRPRLNECFQKNVEQSVASSNSVIVITEDDISSPLRTDDLNDDGSVIDLDEDLELIECLTIPESSTTDDTKISEFDLNSHFLNSPPRN